MMAGLRKKRVPVYPSVCCCSLIGLAVKFHPEVQVADFCKKTRSGHIEPTLLHSHRHFKLSSGCPLGRPQVPQVSMQLGPARPRGHMPTAFHGGPGLGFSSQSACTPGLWACPPLNLGPVGFRGRVVGTFLLCCLLKPQASPPRPWGRSSAPPRRLPCRRMGKVVRTQGAQPYSGWAET